MALWGAVALYATSGSLSFFLFIRVLRWGNVNRRLRGNWMVGSTPRAATGSIGSLELRTEILENKYSWRGNDNPEKGDIGLRETVYLFAKIIVADELARGT